MGVDGVGGSKGGSERPSLITLKMALLPGSRLDQINLCRLS